MQVASGESTAEDRVGTRLTAPAAMYRIQKIAPTPFFADYGCHVRILEQARALARLGHQVVVCTYPDGRSPEGLSIERVPALAGTGTVRVGSSRRKIYLDALLSARALQVAARYRPAIVHAHLHEGALIGAPISRLRGIPLVFDFQGSLTAEMMDHNFLRPESRLYAPLRWLERTIDQLADAILTSTRPAADFLVREFGCPASKIIPVPDAVNTDDFASLWDLPPAERADVRVELGIPADRTVVVYLGLLADYQGSSLLVNAARQVLQTRHDIHFLLMGYPGQERYQAMARQLGIERFTTFTGRVPYENAARRLSAGDLAVAPKVSATEGNGKLLNYMAVGLPTVAFDTPVNRDILGEAGRYAPLGDTTALATRILELVDDPRARAESGRALRRRAEEQFSWIQAAAAITEVYRTLIR